MARSGIQYADVRRAIDELIARGDHPSVQRIREVLGTGSFTTISEHFRHWRDEREQNRDVPPPRDIPDAVVALATDMWRQAQDVANEGLAHYREEANREVTAAREEAQNARHEADNAAQRESALAEHLRHREAHIEGLGAQLAESRAYQAQLEARCDSAEQASKVLREENAARVAQLKQREEAHQQEHQAARDAFDRQIAEEQQRNEATEGRLLALLDDVRQERVDDHKTQQKRTRQLEKRLDAISKDNEQLQRQLKAAREAGDGWQRHGEQLEGSLQDEKTAATQARRETQRLQAQLDRTQRALEEERERHARDIHWQASLNQRLEALQHQLAALPAGSSAKDDGSPT